MKTLRMVQQESAELLGRMEKTLTGTLRKGAGDTKGH